ncbi:MAG: BrxA/BrxB family bacilliredoxin [Ekhidna sp.]|nr:BrxA/BrxB family bacilliredoxin [Ekhidna sp.]MBC6410005.1 BrxA/BrxB family bacilliredoxin [Ekhidna sp.]MBC6424956.1 BrxA/BrxB family bacilliredoxin [Ekhidna sp.]
MYPAELVEPMKAQLTQNGFEEFTTADAVDKHLKDHSGTSLMVINSVCGCAAGTCRPGVLRSLEKSGKKPDNLTTVFAGFDTEATQKAREYTLPFPPSSPSIALFKNGNLVHMVERHHIEGRSAEMIANHLEEVYEEFC